MATRIESHISVLYEVADIDRLREAARAARPLRLRVDRALRWGPPDHGVALVVEDQRGDLRHFRRAVLGTDDADYQPHVTLLHRDSVAGVEQADRAWEALRDLALAADVVVDELVVYEEADGLWREAARVRFGG